MTTKSNKAEESEIELPKGTDTATASTEIESKTGNAEREVPTETLPGFSDTRPKVEGHSPKAEVSPELAAANEELLAAKEKIASLEAALQAEIANSGNLYAELEKVKKDLSDILDANKQ